MSPARFFGPLVWKSFLLRLINRICEQPKNIVPLLCLLLSILKCRILGPWDLPTISNRILDATDYDRTEKDLTAHKFYKVLSKKTTRFWSTTRTQASNRETEHKTAGIKVSISSLHNLHHMWQPNFCEGDGLHQSLLCREPVSKDNAEIKQTIIIRSSPSIENMKMNLRNQGVHSNNQTYSVSISCKLCWPNKVESLF